MEKAAKTHPVAVFAFCRKVPGWGLEPQTCELRDRRSSQLSYPGMGWGRSGNGSPNRRTGRKLNYQTGHGTSRQPEGGAEPAFSGREGSILLFSDRS